ncbi:MAG TPA: hypothetical protein VN643_11995 [Pyrinomonadaceae bacterium]|nr:hypothetical protein [Pyrinomonadaceae bacterium]
MPSITSWARLEPRTRSANFQSALGARVHDPLWLLGRQWQFGEFQGQDGGSPIVAKITAECATLAAYAPGAPGASNQKVLAYDSRKTPLETIVEREPVRTNSETDLRLAAETGQHFIRLLSLYMSGSTYDPLIYVSTYPLEVSDEQRAGLDSNTLRFLSVVQDRVPDGMALYRDITEALANKTPIPYAPPFGRGLDDDNYMDAVNAWLTWYRALISESRPEESAWNSERMEYQFVVAAQGADGKQIVLSAPEYVEGSLDWYSFEHVANGKLDFTQLGTPPPAVQTIERSLMPTRLSFRGMPSRRWWEFEDAQTDFGSVKAAPEDLARMMMTEFALVYGNDWFIVPFDLDVGSLSRLVSPYLSVVDTFGRTISIKPYSQIAGTTSPGKMFGLTSGTTTLDMLFLPPVLGGSLQGPPIEDVLFLRDEMANMAWAVERVVNSPAGFALNRFDAYHEQQQAQPLSNSDSTAAPLAYHLATKVPDYWIPLLPVQISESDPAMRLQRGVLATGKKPQPLGRILEPEKDLMIHEEEVPREGARVTRSFQYARWINGLTHLWVGRRKQPGQGEGSSGLRFDVIESI